jgi:hypothetical protein
MLSGSVALAQHFFVHLVGRHTAESGELSALLPVVILLRARSGATHWLDFNGDAVGRLFVGVNQIPNRIGKSGRQELKDIHQLDGFIARYVQLHFSAPWLGMGGTDKGGTCMTCTL